MFVTIVVGDYAIRPGGEGKMLIFHRDGGGGEFNEADLAAQLDEFWRKHF